MRALIGRSATTQLLRAEPDLAAVQPLLDKAVVAVVDSSAFQSIVQAALSDVHATVFGARSRTFALRLADLGVLIDAAARTLAPGLGAQIPPTLSVTVARVSGGDFGTATDVAQALQGARDGGVWLLVIGLVALLASIAASADRVRAVRRAALACITVGLVTLIVVVLARALVLQAVCRGRCTNGGRGDMGRVLRRSTLLGAPRRSPRRGRVARGRVAGRDWGAVRGGCADRCGGGFEHPGCAGGGAARRTLAAVIALAGSPHGEPALAHPITDCNGSARLCDRAVDEVVFPATHNAMSSSASGSLFPNQDVGIADQLGAGIRGLLIDTHYGVGSPRGVATKFTAQTRKIATVVDKVGPTFIATADRLRAAIGLDASGSPSVYLCHAFCELGATPLVDTLGHGPRLPRRAPRSDRGPQRRG